MDNHLRQDELSNLHVQRRGRRTYYPLVIYHHALGKRCCIPVSNVSVIKQVVGKATCERGANVLENDRAASLAAAILDFRRARMKILPPELFAEPAWDLLLELFLADAEGRRLTARQVCERSNIPSTVMARWLKHLSQNGYVVGDGSGDIDDLLVMSAETLAKMEDLMGHARQLQATGR